jgi:hypothetical protein
MFNDLREFGKGSGGNRQRRNSGHAIRTKSVDRLPKVPENCMDEEKEKQISHPLHHMVKVDFLLDKKEFLDTNSKIIAYR